LYRDVPRSLQTALDLEKNKPLIVKVALFREVTPACTVALLKAMQQLHFPPREYVIVQGQIGTCMYFINRGTVQVTICKDAPEFPICQLKDGDNFGAESLMNPEWRRRANILTLTFCIFHMLDAVDFNAICYRYDELRTALAAEFERRKIKPTEAEKAAAPKSVLGVRPGPGIGGRQRRMSITGVLNSGALELVEPKDEEAENSDETNNVEDEEPPAPTRQRSKSLFSGIGGGAKRERSKSLFSSMAGGKVESKDTDLVKGVCAALATMQRVGSDDSLKPCTQTPGTPRGSGIGTATPTVTGSRSHSSSSAGMSTKVYNKRAVTCWKNAARLVSTSAGKVRRWSGECEPSACPCPRDLSSDGAGSATEVASSSSRPASSDRPESIREFPADFVARLSSRNSETEHVEIPAP